KGDPLAELTAGSVSITSGDGYDKFEAQGNKVTINGAFAPYTGIGDSLFSLNTNTLTLGGAMTVTNGQGSDTFTVGDAAPTAITAQGITLRNGAGPSEVSFLGSGKLTGNFTIAAADGHDKITIHDMDVAGNVTINNGAGGSDLQFKGTQN